MIKVSVIVPAYNTEKYLKKCLDSLVKQTLDDIEIIVINDCSTDKTKDILEKYKRKYKNIKVINNKTNKGIGYNRNLGIKKAKGEFISFIDSDDYVDITMYEKMYNKAKCDKLDLVICNFYNNLEHEDGNTEKMTPKNLIPYFENTTLKNNPDLLLKVELAPWNKLYKKELLDGVWFPEDLKYEDAIVVIKSLNRAKKIGMVDDMLNYYLIRDKGETGTMNEKVFDILTVSKMIVEELKSANYYDEIKSEVEAMTIRNLFRYTLQQRKQKDKVVANKFIDDVFNFLNSEFPNWKKNKYFRKRNVLKRMIESSKILTKTYIKF
ncbi:MAG: glycosyltransferase family 2 protein [Bacilli bacterium]|nr:glycosyltransferase family 2 protein [Bacilli bacterium]